MKIPKIMKNRYVRQIGLFAALVTPVMCAQINYDKELVKNAKAEIKAKDPQRFERLIMKSDKMSKFAWQNELNSMNDSLRLDSVARKAYFEGAQMVRDSINNAKLK